MTAVAPALQRVNAAAQLYESRWTMRALRRVDEALHARFQVQRDLFDRACITGTAAEIDRQGDALCRGYVAIVRAMETAQEAPDAYLRGFDRASGRRVVIGLGKASAAQATPDEVFLTPDEVAVLLARSENALVGDVMQVFPGAEIKEATAAGYAPRQTVREAAE